MYKIQDNAEQFSNLSSSSKDRASAESDAWGDTNFKDQALGKIIRANKKVRLYHILKSYNIQIVKNYPTQTWSNLIQCPFPSHKDRTASFGYNFRSDHFNCLGCKASGKAVEFIAAKEERSKVLVAESILEHYSDSDYIEEEDEDLKEDPRVQILLFEMSESFRTALQLCADDKDRIKNVEKIIWWFDTYLSVRAGARNSCKSTNIDVEELATRVHKAQELLDQIK